MLITDLTSDVALMDKLGDDVLELLTPHLRLVQEHRVSEGGQRHLNIFQDRCRIPTPLVART